MACGCCIFSSRFATKVKDVQRLGIATVLQAISRLLQSAADFLLGLIAMADYLGGGTRARRRWRRLAAAIGDTNCGVRVCVDHDGHEFPKIAKRMLLPQFVNEGERISSNRLCTVGILFTAS